jgi:hypothetical protein
MMHGHLSLAHSLLSSSEILTSLRTENFFYWASALSLLSSAPEGDPRALSDSLHKGLSSLKACLSSTRGGQQKYFSGPAGGFTAAPLVGVKRAREAESDFRQVCCYGDFEFQVWFVQLEIRFRKILEDLRETSEGFLRFLTPVLAPGGASGGNWDLEYDTEEISEFGKDARLLSADYLMLRRYEDISQFNC